MRFKQLNRLFHVLSLLFIATQVSFSQTGEKEALRVLFVGNSFTYFYNLPQVVTAMAETQGGQIITRQSTVGGSNLEQHWKQERGTKTMRLLDSTKWDFVVFNNHSTSSIDDPALFQEYGRKFAELVKSKGAKPVFMLTWAYKSNPLMQVKISEEHEKLAKDTGALLVPGGSVFQQARAWRPDLELFFDDKHPSSNGTYLLGLTFYRFFSGKSVNDIPSRITMKDRNMELIYLLFMSDENAAFLKQLVDEFEMKTVGDDFKK